MRAVSGVNTTSAHYDPRRIDCGGMWGFERGEGGGQVPLMQGATSGGCCCARAEMRPRKGTGAIPHRAPESKTLFHPRISYQHLFR